MLLNFTLGQILNLILALIASEWLRDITCGVLSLRQGLFCLLVKDFYGTRYQSGFPFLNQCGEGCHGLRIP